MFKTAVPLVTFAGLIVAATATRVAAQSRPPAIAEIGSGWAGFVDGWTLTGNVTYDLVRDTGTGRRRVTPYLAAAAGYLSQTTRVGTGRFTSGEGTVSGGLGVRIALDDRWFIAPEVRLGYEPELRALVHVGVRARR